MILFIDNYDSFTYNLVQYFGEFTEDIIVYRNNQVTINDIELMKPDYIIISPGPCTPLQAGISLDVIIRFAGIVPILGVCLGHQAIAHVFGGEVIQAEFKMHGKSSFIFHDNKTIFKDIPYPFRAGRYHSLIVNSKNLPPCLEITAWTEKGEIMGIRHKDYLIEGVQFHPESIMTTDGKILIKNFLKYAKVNV